MRRLAPERVVQPRGAISVIRVPWPGHHELGLMPDAHWRPYARYMTKYIQSPGFKEAWDDIGTGFSEDFARWVNGLLGLA